MHDQTKVTGVILAGGLARRMGGQDKGLIIYKQRPMLAYAIDAMRPAVDRLVINANRNLERYRLFGFPVLTDQNANFEGPLAGILAALRYTQDKDILLVMPCDSPLFTTVHLQKLLTALGKNNAECSVAYDGERLHPVFLALQTGLAGSLDAFLAGGRRKIDLWLDQHRCIWTDFSATPEIFMNVNTLQELAALEARDA
jgi:molybdopterin-guanine dinucleotide biosynthesis protein A